MRLSIRHAATVALALGAGALGIAGCGGSDGEESADAQAGTGVVSVANVDGTDVLADFAGRTLYTADVEKGGKVLCVEACTSFWQPVLDSASEAEAAAAELDAPVGVIQRPGGDEQLTFNGMPLYTFTQERAGQLEGDGFVDDFQGTRFEWEAAVTGSGSDAPSAGRGGGY
jgi:predicted lipoprotein with Yx(FWY)xxD motif